MSLGSRPYYASNSPIFRGTYKGTFVDLRKVYDEEEEDEDVYLATGHMIPWGIYGRWTVPDKPDETVGYWCMWHFEVRQLRFTKLMGNLLHVLHQGAPPFPIAVPIPFGDNLVYVKAEPYKKNPNWFIEYEQARDAGRHYDRQHGTCKVDSKMLFSSLKIYSLSTGWFTGPPPPPEQVPLPETDAYGL